MDGIVQQAEEKLSSGVSPEDTTLAAELVRLSVVAGEEQRWGDAERPARLALGLLARVPEADPELMADAHEAFADALLHSGHEEEAADAFRRCIHLREEHLGPEHASLAESLAGLGIAMRRRNRFDEGEALHRRAWAIDTAVLGPTHPETLNNVMNLAALFEDAGRLEAAELMLRETLRLLESTEDSNAESLDPLLNWHAVILWGLNRIEEAEDIYRRLLDFRIERLGPENAETADTLMSLVELIESDDRAEEMEALCRRALSIREKALGPAHPGTLEAAIRLGGVLKDRDRCDEAEDYFRFAISRADEAGLSRENRVSALQQLGEVLADLERYEESANCFREALLAFGDADAESKMLRADALAGMGSALLHLELEAQAEPGLREALAIYEREFDPFHPAVAYGLMLLARCLYRQGRYEDCLPIQRRELELAVHVHGKESPAVAVSHYNVGQTLEGTFDLAGAESQYRRAIEIDRVAHGSRHPEVARNLMALGELLQKTSRIADARESFVEAVEIFEAAFGVDDEATLSAREALDDLGEYGL